MGMANVSKYDQVTTGENQQTPIPPKQFIDIAHAYRNKGVSRNFYETALGLAQFLDWCIEYGIVVRSTDQQATTTDLTSK